MWVCGCVGAVWAGVWVCGCAVVAGCVGRCARTRAGGGRGQQGGGRTLTEELEPSPTAVRMEATTSCAVRAEAAAPSK
eukprot:1615640-Prymnesium_polylepis.1